MKEAAYAVVGNNEDIFSGAWDRATETDLLTKDSEGVYTKTYANQELDKQTISYKVIKKETVNDGDATAWYPEGGSETNQEIDIPVKGRYDITFTFTEEGSVVTGVATKTAEAVTISDKLWATTVTNSALDFSGSEVDAYTATVKDDFVVLKKVDDIIAEAGLVLKGTAAGTYYIPVIPSSETDKGSLMFSSIYTFDIYSHYTDNYYGLTVDDNNIAKFTLIAKPTGDGKVTIPAQKAFLAIPTNARELRVIFDGEATGISNIAADETQERIYNLNGQRVNATAKGLYIVNGKKVVRK
jgi:hypothetical protein